MPQLHVVFSLVLHSSCLCAKAKIVNMVNMPAATVNNDMAESVQAELLTPYRWQLYLVPRELDKFRHLRTWLNPDCHINTSLNSAAEREQWSFSVA